MKRFLLYCTAVALLCGCSGISTAPDDGVLARVDDIQTGATQTKAAVVEINGKPALLYATQDNRITFQYGDQRQTLDETARVRGGNRFLLYPMDQKLLAMWWSHQSGKNIYSAFSENQGGSFAPANLVNTANGVLPPPSVLRGPDGVLGATYLDERQPGYQFYFNRSADFGRTWAKNDLRLDMQPTEGAGSRVQEPQSVQAGSVWLAVWADTERTANGSGYRIMGRRSEDAGLNWSVPEVIYRPQKFISSLSVQAQGDKVLIAADERGLGIISLTSLDQGSTWRASSFLPGTDFPPNDEGASNSGIEFSMAGDRAHFVWMEEKAGLKVRVMRATLDLAQAKWTSAAQSLDLKANDDTKSTLPVVMASAKGPVWSAWIDYRDIRPNIYVSISSDQGDTWTNPAALLKPGEISVGMPKLMRWKDGVAIAYETYPTERELNGQLVVRSMTFTDAGELKRTYNGASEFSETYRKERLQQRLKSLWDFRITGNYASAYDFFDFAYKAATPKKFYVENAGVIVFKTYSIQDTVIKGNIAAAKMKFSYEVPPTTLPSGKPIKLAQLDTEATHTWVWVGSDWYLMYAPATGQSNLKY